MRLEVIQQNGKDFQQDLWRKIGQIEQDMWAREEGLGEYIVCRECGNISSKQDVYRSIDIEIFYQTVYKIQRILGKPRCVCGSPYVDECYPIDTLLQDYRYRCTKRVHTIVGFDEQNEVVGFMTGYQDDFNSLYDRELSWHYGIENRQKIQDLLEKNTGHTLPQNIFNGCSVGTIHNKMSFKNLYAILQAYFLSMPSEDDDIFGIFELDMRGNLYAIFYALGLQKLGVNQYTDQQNTYYKSDIFFQTGFVRSSKNALQIPMREFLKKYLHIMKQINK